MLLTRPAPHADAGDADRDAALESLLDAYVQAAEGAFSANCSATIWVRAARQSG